MNYFLISSRRRRSRTSPGVLRAGIEARQVGDRAQASRILANLGALSTAQGEYGNAEALLKEGLAEAERIQHVENRILLYINLAELARFREKPGGAMFYLEQAESLAAETKHQRYINVMAEMKAELGFE